MIIYFDREYVRKQTSYAAVQNRHSTSIMFIRRICGYVSDHMRVAERLKRTFLMNPSIASKGAFVYSRLAGGLTTSTLSGVNLRKQF